VQQIKAVALLVTIIGFAMQAVAFDPADLPAVKTAAHGVCVQPDLIDTYLHKDGDLLTGATLSIPGVTATGTITKQNWEAIGHIADQYKGDHRACTASVTAILVAAFDAPKG
jgi:hypothetical protein